MQKILRYWPVAIIYSVSLLFGWWWSGRFEVFELREFLAGFMGPFLILFSALKLRDINGFAERFSTYDLISKKYWWYGQLFPFIELSLGVLMLVKHTRWVDIIMIVLALVGIIGVYGSIIKKERLYCACLGTTFNLPLSYIAIFENVTMLGVGTVMLFIAR